MKNINILLLATLAISVLSSCKEQNTDQKEQTPPVSVKTVFIEKGDIQNYVNLNGNTIYLKKNTIVSPISGYIVKINAKFGDKVKKNDVLFEIQTKENKALESTNTFSTNTGIIKVSASSSGIINELNINETGGYVVEGGVLCSIVENRDLMVQVNVPFENRYLLKRGKKCKIFLSDNSTFAGTIYRILPVVNMADQTQNVLIKPHISRQLPENLNLIVKFINKNHSNAYLVSKKAVMTNETQSEFWVMKIVNHSLAVKIPVLKGIENDSIVELLSSDLNKNDLVISEGAYGLPDSTVVKIVK